jgi:hypothetical protein
VSFVGEIMTTLLSNNEQEQTPFRAIIVCALSSTTKAPLKALHPIQMK